MGAGLLFAGCAQIVSPDAPIPVRDAATEACHREFEALDAQADRDGTRDAEAARVEGFPGLRVNRLLVALAQRAARDEAAFAAWIAQARRLDAEARSIEIATRVHDRAPALTPGHLEDCSNRLAQSVVDDPAARRAVLVRAHVPDDYRTASRALGLYPITRVPFFAGVQRWQRDHERAMREAAAHPRPVRHLGPAAGAAGGGAPRPAALAHDALGLPQPDAAQAEALLAAHAPRFDVEAAGPFDAVSTPMWRADGRPGVSTGHPVVYQRVTHTLVQGRALLQLVYTVWFDERPPQSALDLLAGALDGVIVRLTLGPDGRPLLLDTIHACGCYHLFFPGRGVTLRADAPAHEEWAFVPARLPEIAPRQRLAVRIASGTHYVLDVSAVDDTDGADDHYVRAPEGALRQLPDGAGRTRSLYGPDGLVRGSERGERFLFWPMGIPSAGAMRQWGHHATAFVGRRHFDDADLIDRRFEITVLP